MALTSSTTMALGQSCPSFTLPTVDGKQVNSFTLCANKIGLVIAFWCNHCPYVKAVEDRFLKLSREFMAEEIQFVTICSNDADSYPEDAPKELYRHWLDKKYNFPYLIDESQAVAREFDAQCTPDIFVFDSKGELYYHGQIDDSWKDEKLVKSRDLRNALDDLLAGKPSPSIQKATVGCSIKWKTA